MKKWLVVILIIICGAVFTRALDLVPFELVHIPPSTQRLGGDSAKGFQYLTNGDYVKGGIPFNLFLLGMGKDSRNLLQREGKNEKLSHEYTAITAPNGEVLVAPNCLQCHAQVLDNQLYVGLGNSLIDFTHNEKLNIGKLKKLEALLKLTAPRKYEAAKSFIEVTKAIGPYLETEVKGVNAADRLAALLAAHRDPVTFKWTGTPALEIPAQVIPTDVPAWWLLKKKNAMFYNGFGRGDFGRFLMASNLLTVNDTAESREVDAHMPDVLAFIYGLQAPKYPGTIDQPLARKGESIFVNNCAKCHGTYGDSATYPNLLVPQHIIKTDSMLYTSNYSNPQFVEWFNKSWFTTGDHPAKLEPFAGYIAPPLDGIWITAPYLHNGSVPDLESLLNSKLRPQYWSRDFDNPIYHKDIPGWTYTRESRPGKKNIYNTDLPGYSNKGHYFGDKFSNEERRALIEYLKTL
ncbi:c-type cytochrome [Pseudoflavitalea sp. G-6-1-2]|uniref:c-type cytochrome n=1 Tax=Pseudoflavitalea sp. G-6-1-2 TaxID=2728841 RepID=UPI00146A8DBB|nr:c-type cytochrome [Pseudoflavitalea sp. G-6-1-2]NML22793.1 c-type cytochrome [Pseudoflavitalea sp. G-6-1-2]